MSSSISEMMAKAVTTSDEMYRNPNAIKGYKDRKDDIRRERREKRDTLSQWYGMKKANLSASDKQELELLQYRNFVHPDAQHQAPKKPVGPSNEFVEFGFFAGTGKNKRKRYQSFADEWIEENPNFGQVVSKRIKRNVKVNKKSKEISIKRAAREAERSKMKKVSKRKSKYDKF